VTHPQHSRCDNDFLSQFPTAKIVHETIGKSLSLFGGHMRQPSRKLVQAVFYSLAAILLTLGTTILQAQTFRGGINGTVTDHTGAVIANATVIAIQTETGGSHTTTSSSAGELLFQDLPLGAYSVSASFPGFSTVKTDKVVVSAGTTFTLAIKLTVSSSSTVVEVDAADPHPEGSSEDRRVDHRQLRKREVLTAPVVVQVALEGRALAKRCQRGGDVGQAAEVGAD